MELGMMLFWAAATPLALFVLKKTRAQKAPAYQRIRKTRP